MRKFLFGLFAGVVSAYLILGLVNVGAEEKEDIGKFSEAQSEQMKIAWYEYHHNDLIKGLSDKCE